MPIHSTAATHGMFPGLHLLPRALPLVLFFTACGGAGSGDQLTAPPATGTYHGVASASPIGQVMLHGSVSGSSLHLTFKDSLGETGSITGTFAFSGNRCFTGTAAFDSGARPFALVDCSMKDGQLSATVQGVASATSRTSLLSGSPNTFTLMGAAATPTSSGTVYAQYNYDDHTFTPILISSQTDDLVMSNYVAGAMLGHLIRGHAPGVTIDRDRLYASIFAHLVQEDGGDLEVTPYDPSTGVIDGAPGASIVNVQGGPYQINSWCMSNFYGDWVNGVAPRFGLVNVVALQGSMSWTVEDQIAHDASGVRAPAPDIFNDKYWAPMATAFWHYLDLQYIEKQNNSSTPSYNMASCETALAALTSPLDSRYNVLDLVLNASYNSGAAPYADGVTMTEALISLCQGAGTTGTQATITGSALSNTLATSDYATAVGVTSTTYKNTSAWLNYPRQLRFTEDQLNGPNAGVNPYPTSMFDTITQKAITPTYNASVVFVLSTLEAVFENVMASLHYVNGAGSYVKIDASAAQAAFVSANTTVNTGNQTYLQLTSSTDRKLLFDILDAAIQNLEDKLKASNPHFTSFADTTQTDL